ncbi:MAG: DUF3035 domain-containing protein [Pseudomonadota bacterium]
MAISLALLGTLSACGAGQVFGIDRSTPDEFAVVSRAPLTLPPDYDLRPPEPGAPRPQEGTAADQVGRILTGGEAAAGPTVNDAIVSTADGPAPLSSGEQTLLAGLGAGQADPDIRRLIDAESDALYSADEGLLDRLLFWQTQDPDGVVIDASGEARRLAENEALGQPIDAGEVPIIERRQRALLEGLFN